MTWIYIATGVVIPVLGWVIRLGWLSWQRRQVENERLRAANETAGKYKHEAEIHAKPRRDKLSVLERLRAGRDAR